MGIIRKKILKTDTEVDRISQEYSRTFNEIFNSLDDVKSFLQIDSLYTSNLPSINLAKCLFNFDVEFLSFKFTENITFSESIFIGKVDFIATEFNGDYIEGRDCELISPNNFFGAVFLDNVNFESTKFKSGACFRCTKFKKWFNLKNAQIDGNLDIRFSNFVGEVNFSYLDGETFNTQNTPLNITLDETTFQKKALFYNRVFEKCSFSNTKFEALADFFNSTFNEDVCFNKTDFLGTVVYAESTFNRKAIFLYTQVNRNMILRRTQFFGGVNLALINFIGEGYINSLEVNIKDVEADGDISKKSYEELGGKINIRHKRESFRILKHEALKQNNRIEALKYHALEMRTYEQELKQSKKPPKCVFKRLLKFLKEILLFLLRLFAFDNEKLHVNNDISNDKLILYFNKISNNFGSNWIKSFSFTFWLAILWYVIFLSFVNIDTKLCWDWDNGGETIKYALQFLNITEWDYKPFDADYSWAYIPLLIGRILIGLGIYQTIQAFRKYGRF